ncbi:MAG: hydrogenase 4 subunit B [Gammaproteobacteria bacterium]|nr:hydrogenase 4 subunit B [Gammaproteobacteria bacterium]
MSVVVILTGCIAALLAVGVVAIALARLAWINGLVYAASLVVSATALTVSLSFLLAGVMPPSVLVLPLGIPWLGANFRLDMLAAFFLIVVNLGGAAASLYGLGYGRHESAPARVLPFFPVFLAAMNLVILADDAYTFLFSWEFMSLSSWALVMSHHREQNNTDAGYIYLMMASAGTLALLLAFGLLAGSSGGYHFALIRGATYAPWLSGAVFGLTLFGAGSKAGLFPLHVWLPLAHPAAPSHISALMSGVMTKVAIYAVIRLVFDLLGPPLWWWSLVVLALGGITAVMGVLYALMQHDLKRLLAFHTVENIGIIFIGLGLALAFEANGFAVPAALALVAALFHVLNHALFKSLLFFGAGAVQTATGERDMEHLGGLIHRMPLTAFAFLAGSVAISALPPLNGFVSEWLTFQAILVSPELPQWGLKLLVPAVGAMLALSAALAAACFVKAFGITFLGRSRSAAAAAAVEVDRYSLATMFALVALCLLAGIFPGFVIDAIAPVTRVLVGAQIPVQADVPWMSIVPIAEARSSYNGLTVFLFIAASAIFAAVAIHRLASRKLRRAPAWDCGFADPNPNPFTQYTATSLVQPIRRVFGAQLFLAREEVLMPPPGDMRPASLQVQIRDLVWDTLYAPIENFVGFTADLLNRVQFLTIRRYLTLVFVTLVALLLVLALWQ